LMLETRSSMKKAIATNQQIDHGSKV